MDNQTYYTHNNGSRSFKVNISTECVKVVRGIADATNNYEEYYPEQAEFIRTFRNLNHIFIGHSPKIPMTEFSGGYGDLFNGNSILIGLFKERVQTYIHIGCSIFSFTPYAEIIEYVSPVGNNDVPYPYAVDSLGNYYLMIEYVILLHTPTLKEEVGTNPYRYYYDRTLMTIDEGRIPPEQPIIPYFKDIKEFYMDDEDGYSKYTLRYVPKTRKRENTKLYIIKTTGEKIELTDVMYTDIMAEYGELMSFEPMETTIIQHRIW
jgi:hypothetical protein